MRVARYRDLSPAARFAVANLINTCGTGLYLVLGALYLTRVLGLNAGDVALVLGSGTAAGLMTAVLLGRAGDAFGARNVYAVLLLLQAACMIALSQASTLQSVAVIAVFSGVAERGVAGLAGGLVHALSSRETRMEARALLRTTTNVGIGIGTLIAGLVLALDTSSAYRASLVANALAFAATALLILRLPAGIRASEAPPLRNRRRPSTRYMAVSAACGILSLQIPVLSFVLPLWVAAYTDAPLWSVSAVVGLNTVIVVLTQVRVSRQVHDFRSAHRATGVATVCLVVACSVMPATAGAPTWVSLSLLVTWCLLMTGAELFQSTSQFFYSFELAPDDAQSTFQSAFSIGPGAFRALGPAVLVALVMEHPLWGWLTLGGIFALGGAAQIVTAQWATHAVEPPPELSPTVRGTA